MEDYITIFINGEPFNCNSSMSLKSILIYLNINISSVIIEYNNQIIDQLSFGSLFFVNNDRLEIITIAGGG
uniref:Thiamin biosynthesis protein S n=1 Tax=Dasyclonium flaccidum TaxID=2007274 RepID=A0A1Z1MKY5_9FLOR|nr:thiamin biosynthesis protein S [Dasyclonium flaccidum]ARW66718.1 thiamin biosynthesis protein S [Dasyclonium flaccidum]